MAKHEFGIMEKTPLPGARYDDYEPQKYACISVDDDWIEPILFDLNACSLFFHSLDVPGKGLDYAGITLIPPDAVDELVEILGNSPMLGELRNLLLEAKARNRFVIHFGI